jgi:hypothetical protein
MPGPLFTGTDRGIAKSHWPTAPTPVLCSTQYRVSYEDAATSVR